MKLKVLIRKINPTEVVGNYGFEKRILIGETIEQYPNTFKFEFQQNNVNLLDDFMENQIVEIDFNLKGKKVENHTYTEPIYFITLVSWNIQIAE